ncbi:prealbumin-like fold domain-containing protein [Hymenobacter sp. 5516J-16]|uniref:SpaA isopeptide-forming pilin-related protein n=1 Tax=Hymenobacter sp. 5516J-16 TaxID=2932253 RepID=UPI001FD41397|nr:SpaA isopeptide-forming pilin-related protein [Hymenobacter sp. 5516J-16]UOQ75773.1 prealbumin-like fold domain-containing protein [Hymenobacter sp. 5516J-16]
MDGANPAATVSTDANGRFEFANLKAGTYNLTYTRPDLGTYRRVSVGHVGGDQPTFAFTSFLTQSSSTRILNPTVSSNSYSGTATLQFSLVNPVMPTGSLYRYQMYVGSMPNVTTETGTLYANTTYGTSSSYASQVLTRASLNAVGLASGRTAYVVVYGVPNTFSSYIDPATGRTVYMGLGVASNTVAFIVP